MSDLDLLGGLNALFNDSFPKKCSCCGKLYHSEEQFFKETTAPGEKSLKSSQEDDGTVIVEAFRNCSCGSTLMDEFADRRDTSEKGLRRRKRFDEIVAQLVEKGLDRDKVVEELKYFIRHGESEFLKPYMTKPK